MEDDKKEVLELVAKYESALKNKERVWFDEFEYLQILYYYQKNNERKKAFTLCKNAFSVFADSFEIRLNLLFYLVENKQYKKALSTIKPHIINPYVYQKEKDDILNVFIKKTDIEEKRIIEGLVIDLINKNSKKNFDFYLLLRQIYFATKDTEKLLSVYHKILQRYAADSRYWDELSLYATQNEEAIDDILCIFYTHIQESPYNEILWYNISLLQKTKHDYHRALEAIDYAIHLNPECRNYWTDKGGILLEEKRIQESIECYKKAIEIEDYDIGNLICAYYCLGVAYMSCEEFSKAREAFLNAIKHDQSGVYTTASNTLPLITASFLLCKDSVNSEKYLKLLEDNFDSMSCKTELELCLIPYLDQRPDLCDIIEQIELEKTESSDEQVALDAFTLLARLAYKKGEVISALNLLEQAEEKQGDKEELYKTMLIIAEDKEELKYFSLRATQYLENYNRNNED